MYKAFCVNDAYTTDVIAAFNTAILLRPTTDTEEYTDMLSMPTYMSLELV